MSDDRMQIEYNVALRPLEAVLKGVNRAGDYYVQGSLETPMPRIEVEGVGVLSFPLPEAQIEALIRQAVRAPYGRGEETILDTAVRQVWQVEAQRVQIGGRSWPASFDRIVSRVVSGLGCDGVGVSAQLYKLLIYDRGGFFVAHRDTEKAPGMFGTLVVVLPSAHRGGELVIRHGDREVVADSSGAEFSELAFVGFYADCEHEVRPVTEGYRVCLVYSLIRQRGARGRGQALQAPDYDAESVQASALLEAALGPGGSTVKVAWLLEHQYTPEALSFATLKPADAAKAKVLVEAAERAGCVAHLAIVHIEESGPAEILYSPSRYRRWNRHDEEEDVDSDEFEVIEVSDSSRHLDGWRDLEDRPVGFGQLPLADGELLPAGALDGEPPDEQRLTEATGNEGASFERSYHRAALVIWHRDRYPEVLLQGGVKAVLPYFRERIDALPKRPAPGACQPVTALAERLLAAWGQSPADEFAGGQVARSDAATRTEMLRLLVRLGEPGLVERFLKDVVTPDYDGSENVVLVDSARLLEARPAGELLAGLMQAQMPRNHRHCARLLHDLVRKAPARQPGWPEARRRVAAAAVAGLDAVGKPDTRSDYRPWLPENPTPPPTLVTDLLGALAAMDAEDLSQTAGRHFAARPEVFDPVTCLVPALEALGKGEKPRSADPATVRALWDHASACLLQRSETPPAPPSDWRQEVKIDCGCADCRELQAFVLDPHQQTHRFRIRQDRRAHLHRQIERHRLDMTHETERKGSPQTLVCTKDRRGYQRRCDAYRRDIEAMATLIAVAGRITGSDTERLDRLAAATGNL